MKPMFSKSMFVMAPLSITSWALLTSCNSNAQTVTIPVLESQAVRARTSANNVSTQYLFPADAGVVDVSKAPYNIDPKILSPQEVTKRLNQAIADHTVGKGIRGRTIYLPDGVYTVTDTIAFVTWAKENQPYEFPFLTLQGQSRDKTVIRLAPNTPGFTNREKPKAIVSTLEGPSKHDGPNAENVWSFVHFGVFVENLTVESGAGNAGAIGVNFLANNVGALRDVTVRGEGWSGLDFRIRHFAGPAIVKNVSIEGFDYGVDADDSNYCMTFENIHLKNQRVAGVRNDQMVQFWRNVQSDNRVPVFLNTQRDGMMVVDGAQLRGGAANATAIQNDAGHFYARNLRVLGYGASIRDGKKTMRGDVRNWVSQGGGFGANGPRKDAAQGLDLPVRDAPPVPRVPISDWVNVRDFGATAEATNDEKSDDSAAIQRAIDSMSDKKSPYFGKTTLYFPNLSDGWHKHNYHISRPLRLHGKVRRVVGFGSGLAVMGALKKKRAATFIVEKIESPTLWIERFASNAGDGWEDNWTHFVEHSDKTTLVLRDIFMFHGYIYRAKSGAGNVFMEDVHALWHDKMPQEPGLHFVRGQKIWARQFNPEKYPTAVLNDGATLWILGYKFEFGSAGGGTLVHNRGGRVEIMGCMFWSGAGLPDKRNSAFINEDGQMWVSVLQSHARKERRYTNVLLERIKGRERALPVQSVPQRDGWAEGFIAPAVRSGF